MNLAEYASCDGAALAELVRKGVISPREALDAAFGIIERLDGRINAFISLEREQAYRLAEQPNGGPLHGVPLAMKDCVGYVQGVKRSFGSRLAAGMDIDFDAEVVARYKRAGLVPMGTTNVPELSSSVTTESLLHGPCRNPWNAEHTVGGSSGGAGAAVAAGMVPIAYGNDGAGSIRIPASCCGAFGFRPSRGRVPTGPHDGEFWYGLMVHHVITRSVRDSALALDISEGIDPGAPYGAPDKKRPYVEEVGAKPGRLRVAVSDGGSQGFSLDSVCRAALDDAANLLVGLGHDVKFTSPGYSGAELLENVNFLIAIALAREIPAIAEYMQRPIGPDTVEACHLALMQRGSQASALNLTRVLRYRTELGRDMGRFFQDFDVLLTPTLASPPIRLGELDANSDDVDAYLERMWRFSPFTPLANVCGIPSMSVPMHWTGAGLPVGMMFTAAYANEGTLFQLAGQLEAVQPWKDRHPPISAWRL